MDAQWPYLHENNVHSQRKDIQWLSIQHSIVHKDDIQTKNASIINSIIHNECNIGNNVAIYNSIVGNRVTLGDNSCIQSVDFSTEVKKCLVLISFFIFVLKELSCNTAIGYHCSTYYFIITKFKGNIK